MSMFNFTRTLTRTASGSLIRAIWNRDRTSGLRRRARRAIFRPAVDHLESRVALAITSPLSIGGTTVGSFTDTPTGLGNLGDFVTVSIEGTKGTVIFNGGTGVADGTDIQTIEIRDASPDFQVTFNATIQTANPVPYASDGIVQLGAISTANVIRGINTVRGPLTNVAVTTSPPLGFTQTTPGSGTIFVEGDQTSAFAGNFVATTPLLPSPAGAPSFASVTGASFDVLTNVTTVTLDNATAAGTTAGALTLATTIQPEFHLTSFVGVNFSNNALQDMGGLFVDVVRGADTVVNGTTYENLGILLSNGLLPSSTIGIRKELDAVALIGTSSKSSTDGRFLVENATADSRIVIGPRTATVDPNSRFQLIGGRQFGAAVDVGQSFIGVMNIAAPVTGTVKFLRGVGGNARLSAMNWADVRVTGDFAGTINSTDGGPNGDITLAISRNVTGTARVNSYSDVLLGVGGSIQQGAVVSADSSVGVVVAGNLRGTIQADEIGGTVVGSVSGASLSSSGDLSLTVGGSVVNSTLVADNDFEVNVRGNIANSKLQSNESDMTVDVDGSVTNSSLVVGASEDLTLDVGGNLTGSSLRVSSDIRANVAGNVSKSQFISTTGDVTLDVGGDITGSQLIAPGDVDLTVDRDALNVRVASNSGDPSLDIGRNFSGTVQSGSDDVILAVGGSVLKGSSITAGGDALVDVNGNFDGSVTSQRLRYFVDGNVSEASRIVAQQVTDWTGSGPNFGIGGRLDGIVNVGNFDAAPNYETVTIVGAGAGSTARFNVGRFETDNLVFNGNFLGNLRVLQDLRANMQFNGNMNRMTIGGRVGSYDAGNSIAPVPVSINVAGRLNFLNSNSFFQPAVLGKSGTFYNDALGTQSTGLLTTGRYVTVVPRLPLSVTPPGPTPSQTYTAPTAPLNFTASPANSPDRIRVTFDAPSSDGGLPVVYYEYTTDGGTNWRRFDIPFQGPGINVPLSVASNGAAFVAGLPGYSVGVRAVNAVGATATSFTPVTIPV